MKMKEVNHLVMSALAHMIVAMTSGQDIQVGENNINAQNPLAQDVRHEWWDEGRQEEGYR